MERQTPHELLPKLFGELRERYAERPGGYTRVLRIEPIKDDQAPSAILELVDGPKDTRFAMTAATLQRVRKNGQQINEMTQRNIEKVTRFRPDGKEALTDMVKRLRKFSLTTATKKEREHLEAEDTSEGALVGEFELPGEFDVNERRVKRGKNGGKEKYPQIRGN